MRKNNEENYKVDKETSPSNLSFRKEMQDLQSQNEILQIKIKNERLLWIIVVLILSDFLFFKDMQTWSGPLIIGLLEILILLLAAHHWALHQMITLWKDILNTFNKNNMD
jgi:hypothetical protein